MPAQMRQSPPCPGDSGVPHFLSSPMSPPSTAGSSSDGGGSSQQQTPCCLSQRVIPFSSLTQSKTLPTLLPATLTTSQTRRNLQKYSKHLVVVPPRQLNPHSLSHTAPGGKPTAWRGRGGHAAVISASLQPSSMLQPPKPSLAAGLALGAWTTLPGVGSLSLEGKPCQKWLCAHKGLQRLGLPLLTPMFICFFGAKTEQQLSRAGEREHLPGHNQQVRALREDCATLGSSPLFI